MGRATVEYEETVTREESFEVCDDCGREVDDDGAKFSLTGDSYVGMSDDQRYNIVGTNLHFCSECLDNMMEQPVGPGAVRVRNWLDETDRSDITLRDNVKKAYGAGKAALLMSFVSIGLLFVLVVAESATALLIASMLLVGLHSILGVYVYDAAEGAADVVERFE